jgi:ParB family transcriptional regulator, chromosome partitioning protein
MNKKAQIDLSNLFSGAEYSQEVHALETKITELQAEIEQLRSVGSQQVETKVQELRSTLTSGGVIDILVEQIDPNPDQPRQTFSPESINGMMISLASDGQQEPIILIEQPDGRLAADLKQAMRTQGLGGIQAIAVQRCNAKALGIKEAEAKKVRAKLVKRILQEKLSVAKTRALVSSEISSYQKEQAKEQTPSRATSMIRQVQEIAIDNMEQQELEALKVALASKLHEIESMLS